MAGYAGAAPTGGADSIEDAAAHWIDTTELRWVDAPDVARYELRYSPDAAIQVTNGTVTGGERLPLTPTDRPSLDAPFRAIADAPAFTLGALDDNTAAQALRSQLVAIAYDDQDTVIAATLVQRQGALDAYHATDLPLGPQYNDDGTVAVHLWAPTAQSVTLHLFDANKNRIDPIQPAAEQPGDGIWRFNGDASWDRAFYRFEVEVYHPATDSVHTFSVTDPYAMSLATDGAYSQFVDLDGDESLKPEGWDAIQKEQPRPSSISVYEAHLRDFSIHDRTVPEAHRGTYRAFTHTDSDGMQHLQRLQEAGLTHLHLLPFNDIGTVREDTSERVDLSDTYGDLCSVMEVPRPEACTSSNDHTIRAVFDSLAAQDPATPHIQQHYHPDDEAGLAAYDGFNWGYDPVHFNTPEGSYATEPDGAQRVLEVREMVSALHDIGLHVAQDVVYNHTHASGLSDDAVFDQVVPGYYHRYDPVTGAIETSTCCDNTAAEFAMVERFIIDSVRLWATHYKIDAFRFDLMGHHPRSVMEHITEALAELTPSDHGVDGDGIYLYGEGWNFGEVANDRLFDQARQFNMGGTGIGNFNDRIRDAIRGGNFTDTGRRQGFGNGLHLFPNEDAEEDTPSALLEAADRIRVGMAGNLASYRYENRTGRVVTGSHEDIGYAEQPQESVNYIDKHDNETLWDNTQTKLPRDLSMEERVRVHAFNNAFILFGQGVPFFQMGTDLLRSKSLDRNSYDSGDWFNLVDFSLDRHGWGRGLPHARDNEPRWDAMRSFLRDSTYTVERDHMEQAHAVFQEQMAIRYSTKLFQIGTADLIQERVAFHNTGPDQIPGLIAMTIGDACHDFGGNIVLEFDADYDGLLVLFNADRSARTVDLASLGLGDLPDLELHPIQSESVDPVLREAAYDDGTATVPPLSASVFVAPKTEGGGDFVCNDR